MNFKHLYYFWMIVRAGGVLRAGERLNITPQTLSAQIKSLEARLGCRLFERNGRTLRPTEAGRVAAAYAERIFQLGHQLEGELKGRGEGAAVRDAFTFKVGIAESVPKSVAHRLLEPLASESPSARIEYREGSQSSLLADLEVHRVDLVLSSAVKPVDSNLRTATYWLGFSGLAIFAASDVRGDGAAPFPACLDGMPMLIPPRDSALRRRLDDWFCRMGVSPGIAEEVGDWGVIMALGRHGRGAFAAPAILETALLNDYGVKLIGHIDDLYEDFYAISHERHICHPWVIRVADVAHAGKLDRDRHVAL